jgi:hypothetical protein
MYSDKHLLAHLLMLNARDTTASSSWHFVEPKLLHVMALWQAVHAWGFILQGHNTHLAKVCVAMCAAPIGSLSTQQHFAAVWQRALS